MRYYLELIGLAWELLLAGFTMWMSFLILRALWRCFKETVAANRGKERI